MRRPDRGGRQAGQAQIELIAAVPLLLVAAVVAIQLFSVAQAQMLADGSAEAAAIAMAGGASAEEAARAAVPDWPAERVEVRARGADGRIEVRLRPRSLIPGAGRHLVVSSTAWLPQGPAR